MAYNGLPKPAETLPNLQRLCQTWGNLTKRQANPYKTTSGEINPIMILPVVEFTDPNLVWE